jgi:DNA invertase Pin-like site-specific DNA recombinase
MNEEKPKFVSYARLSSKKQDRDGLSFESQQTINDRAINERNGIKIAEFVETGSAWVKSRLKGKKRPIFEEACKLCQKENATLVIARADRGARDSELFYALQNQGINFLICDMPFAEPLSLSIIIAMSEYYSTQLSKNIKVAMNTKRKRGDLMGYNAQKTHPNMSLHILFKHIPANVELIKSKKVSTMIMILKDYLDEYRQFNSILDFDTLSRPNDVTKKEDMMRVREACNHINKYCRADFELKDESDNIDPITFRKEIYRITKIVKTFKKFFGDMTIQEAEKVCNDKQFITDYYNRTKETIEQTL